MTRETLGEIALNRQDKEKDIPFFTPESEEISDGEESVHPALKDAESIVCEGQEAMWVEDDVNEIFRRASSKEAPMNKKKNKFILFRGKRKNAQKAVVLLPPQPLKTEDVENQENQLAPENHLEQAPTPEKDKEGSISHTEEGVAQNNSDTEEHQLTAVSENNEPEKDDDVDDVVHGSIDIPYEILEEMRLQAEDEVERARRDLGSEGSDSNSQLSSYGFPTDSPDLEEEYGVEMNIPSTGKAVEIVGTGPMMLVAETIEQADESGQVSEGKNTKWGLLRIFKNKPKQQKVSLSSRDDMYSKNTKTEDKEVEDNSSRSKVIEPAPISPEQLDLSNQEPDRYSVAAPKAALADDMEDSDTFSDDDVDDEGDEFHSSRPSEDDEEDDFDDRYRIGPPKMSKSETNDDLSTASTEQEIIPSRAEDKEPTASLQIDCLEEATVVSKVEQSGENTDEPQIVEHTPEQGVDEVDETNDLISQEEKVNTISNQPIKKSEKAGKQKSRFGGIFCRRKMNKKSTTSGFIVKKEPKATESPSVSADDKQVSRNQSEDSLNFLQESNHPEPSPVASMKGDSMTVIANAVSKGALMAVESNLEAEGTLKSRRIRTRAADSTKDVIDLIRERTQNNKNGLRKDPLDSCATEVQMSMSKDPSGKSMLEQTREANDTKCLMHLAPTPRAKKPVEKVEEEQAQPSEISHQQQITQRLYGTPPKGNGQLLASKKVYIGDLLQRASTDPTVDSAFSDEKETDEVGAVN